MLNLTLSRSLLRFFYVSMTASLALENPSLLISRSTESSGDSTSFDEKLFFALGMIESGNDDRGIGRAGEVSRYQIHPSV